MPWAEGNRGLKSMAEHVPADHLETVFDFRRVLRLLILGRLTLQLRLDLLFRLAQGSGNALHAVVVRHAGQSVAAVREMFILQVGFQLTLRQPHGDAAHAVIFIRIVARPGLVDGNVARQRAVIDDHHGKVAAHMAVAMAVQNALGGVPLGAGDDSVVMRRLVILVLFSPVDLALVIVEIGCPCFAGQYVAAVAFVAQDAVHAAVRPFGAAPAADLPQAGLALQIVERCRDL